MAPKLKKRKNSFASRLESNGKKNEMYPSPQDYIIPPTMSYKGKIKTPSFSFGQRYLCFPKSFGPGPGAYSIGESKQQQNLRKGPTFSTANRLTAAKEAKQPGPTSYNMPSGIGFKLPHKPERYKATAIICGRPKSIFDQIDPTPGPSSYKIPNITIFKRTSPGVVMGKKPCVPTYINYTVSPGPGAYDVVGNSGKGKNFSFGKSHSSKRAYFKQKQVDNYYDPFTPEV